MFVIPAINADRGGRDCPESICLWPFARMSSLPAGEDTDAAIYTRLIRSGFGRSAPSRELESNAKTKAKIIKWIPAFAGMTVVVPHRETFSTALIRNGLKTDGAGPAPALHRAPGRLSGGTCGGDGGRDCICFPAMCGSGFPPLPRTPLIPAGIDSTTR